MGLVPLQDTQRVPLPHPPCKDTAGKCLWTRKWALTQHWIYSILILDLPASITIRNIYCLMHGVCCLGLSWWVSGKESTAKHETQILGIGKIFQRRKRQPHFSILAGKSHGQRNLAGYSPWVCKRVQHNLETKQQHLLFKFMVFFIAAQTETSGD